VFTANVFQLLVTKVVRAERVQILLYKSEEFIFCSKVFVGYNVSNLLLQRDYLLRSDTFRYKESLRDVLELLIKIFVLN